MSTQMFSARLENQNYEALKKVAAGRGITAGRLLNEILTTILPQMAKPGVRFIWLRTEDIGK